ncbi:MAG: hypothetical protein KDB27_00750 [Planctomycetales bacterium]|nr:hypothetical protein [Planctomycetales bacterium]
MLHSNGGSVIDSCFQLRHVSLPWGATSTALFSFNSPWWIAVFYLLPLCGALLFFYDIVRHWTDDGGRALLIVAVPNIFAAAVAWVCFGGSTTPADASRILSVVFGFASVQLALCLAFRRRIGEFAKFSLFVGAVYIISFPFL